jgi:hypothetical protein
MLTFITVVMIAQGVGSSTQVLVPKSEFKRAGVDACAFKHLHAANPLGVLPLIGLSDGDRIADPMPTTCGYGELRNLSIFRVPSPPNPDDSDLDGLPDLVDPFPFDADGDDNGIPDGMSDTDLDGLTDEFEVNVSMTNPGESDSNMDGVPDGVEYGLENFNLKYTHIPTVLGALNLSGLMVTDLESLVPNLNKMAALGNVRLVPTAFAADINEDTTGGVSDGIITADERFGLEQSFNSWLVDNYGGGIYAGFGFPGYSPDTSNSRGYGRLCQYSTFARSDQSDDMKAAITMRYQFMDFGLMSPLMGMPDDVDNNLLVDPSRLESEVNLNGLNNLMLSPEARSHLGIHDPFRAAGRQTRVMGFDVSQVPYGCGNVADDHDDNGGGPAYTDLEYASIYSDLNDDVTILLSFYGAPTATDLVLDTRIRFNLDNDPEADFEYVIERSRLMGESETTVRAFSNDLETFTSAPELEPFRLTATHEFDTGAIGAGEVYMFKGSKSLLNPSLTTVAVDIFVEDENAFVVDTASLNWVLDQSDWDPTFSSIGSPSGYLGSAAPPAVQAANATLGGIAYLPGQVVAISFTGLTALTSFDLTVDDAVVLQDTTDASGDFSGNFVVPPGTPAGNRFLTAQDATGEFAGSILVVPEPTAAESTWAALLALAFVSRIVRPARLGHRVMPGR